jgi:hypothetical protein
MSTFFANRTFRLRGAGPSKAVWKQTIVAAGGTVLASNSNEHVDYTIHELADQSFLIQPSSAINTIPFQLLRTPSRTPVTPNKHAQYRPSPASPSERLAAAVKSSPSYIQTPVLVHPPTPPGAKNPLHYAGHKEGHATPRRAPVSPVRQLPKIGVYTQTPKHDRRPHDMSAPPSPFKGARLHPQKEKKRRNKIVKDVPSSPKFNVETVHEGVMRQGGPEYAYTKSDKKKSDIIVKVSRVLRFASPFVFLGSLAVDDSKHRADISELRVPSSDRSRPSTIHFVFSKPVTAGVAISVAEQFLSSRITASYLKDVGIRRVASQPAPTDASRGWLLRAKHRLDRVKKFGGSRKSADGVYSLQLK